MNEENTPKTLPAALAYFTHHASPRIIGGAAILFVLARLWFPFAWIDLAIIAGGLLAWPFIEWLIHRFVLHFRPVEVWGIRIDPKVPKKHRAHHRAPFDISILFIPVHTYLYTLPILAVLSWALTPTLAQAITVMAFVTVMGLQYEWIHFLIHTRYRPKSAWYRRLWRSHRLHHCLNEHYWLGVTMLAGDWILGTHPDPEATERSQTCRDLFARGSLDG